MKVIQHTPYLIIENCKGRQYELRTTHAKLFHSKEEIDVYFFTKVKSPVLKGERTELPSGKIVRENPRNGFLAVYNDEGDRRC